MPLTSDEIAALVAELSGLIDGAAVENVHQRDEHAVVLSLYSRRAGKLYLLFSTRPRCIRFHLVPERPPALPEPPPFCESARKRLKGSRVGGVRQVSGDRVIEISFARQAEDDRQATVSLVFELIGARGQLVIVSETRTLLASLHPCHRGAREIALGEPYRFPQPRAQPPQLKALGNTLWRYLETDVDPNETPRVDAPRHFALARRYAEVEEAEILREKREALTALLRREVENKEGLARRVREDLARLDGGDEYRKKGELLKGSFHRLKRGMTSVEVENFFDPALETLEIELEPALSPQQNVERYFKRFQKSRRGIPVLRERLAKVEVEHQRALELLARLEGAETLEAVEALAVDAKRFGARRRAAKQKGPKSMAPLGPRRFVSGDGFEILVGRSARQNDELTLRTARGNDIFLHVSGRPGSHVIVRSIVGKQAPLETLLDAAQLALFYSLPERTRSTAGAGAAADVDYTPVKHVRKPRGAKPGLVLLATHKSLRVRLEPERLERLKHRAGEESPGGDDAREN